MPSSGAHPGPSRRWRWLALPLLLGSLSLVLVTTTTSSTAERLDGPPNIVIINLDDADWDLLSDDRLTASFPNIKANVRDRGLRFTNVHVTDPLCGPSRASLFRGQYPHNTGIERNARGWEIFHDRGFTDAEIGMWLREAGYTTALVGKYCHSRYPEAANDDGYVPPGWDFFHASLGGSYFGVQRNLDGERVVGPAFPAGYRTDLELASARRFLAERSGAEPFFLYFAPFAPHSATDDLGMAAPRHRHLHRAERVERTPDFNERDIADKPVLASLPLGDAGQIRRWDLAFRHRLQAMEAVDEAIGSLFADLEAMGSLDSTYVVLTSDNGYHLGHHRMAAKKSPYDRDTRVPFFIVGPGIEPGSADHLLSHIDVVPTVLELASADRPHVVDAKSFVPLLDDPTSVPAASWQDAVLIENVEPKTVSGVVLDLEYRVLRRHAESYIAYADGVREYYDLSTDPYQLENAYDDLRPAARAELAAELDRLAACAGAACHGGDPVDPVDTRLDPIVPGPGTGVTQALTGLATDDDAVDGVEVVVRHVATRSYWDGAAGRWVRTYATTDAELTARGSSETRWSLEVPLRSGEHWVSARARDEAGNEDAVVPTAFFDGSPDPPPSVTIVSPAAGRVVRATTTTITGTVASPVGVDRVELAIWDKTRDRWWNGSSWQSRYVRNALPSDGASETVEWAYRYPTPSGTTSIYAAAWAWDAAGRFVSTSTGGDFTDFRSDPVRSLSSSIASPTGQRPVIGGTTVVTGTAVSAVGVDRVELVVLDKGRNRWWNGSSWQSTYTRAVVVNPEPSARFDWTLSYPTPPGRSSIYAAVWAWDADGRFVSTNTGGDFVDFESSPTGGDPGP